MLPCKEGPLGVTPTVPLCGQELGRTEPLLRPIVSELRWPQTTFVLIRRLAPSKSVVHADQDSGRGRLGVEGTTGRTD